MLYCSSNEAKNLKIEEFNQNTVNVDLVKQFFEEDTLPKSVRINLVSIDTNVPLIAQSTDELG